MSQLSVAGPFDASRELTNKLGVSTSLSRSESSEEEKTREEENDDIFAGASPSRSCSHTVGVGSQQKPAETR